MSKEEEIAKFITVLDFVDSRVYQYKLEVLDNADDNTYERFITNKGHEGMLLNYNLNTIANG
jgi:hypothetical protein